LLKLSVFMAIVLQLEDVRGIALGLMQSMLAHCNTAVITRMCSFNSLSF